MRFIPFARSRVPGAMPLSLLGLAVLAGGSPVARAADPPPPAVVLGTVLDAINGRPVPYTNVVITDTRIGAQTDEQGRFTLTGIPPGRVELRIVQLGNTPLIVSLDLAPGDTLRPTFRLEPPPNQRFTRIRDSLATRGLWPPTLDPPLRQHMRDALDVRVFRLDPEHPVFDKPADPKRRVGPWPIVGEAAAPDRALIEELIETLRKSDLYLPDIRGEQKVCGGFSPGLDVRFTNTGVPVDVLLCFKCGEFSIWRDGKDRQAGDFMDQGPFFVRFAQEAFPRDPELKKLGKKNHRAAR